MSELETPRVLVEGGPVHRHLSRWLALLTGLMIGVCGGLGYTALRALDASSEIQADRHRSCVKANERHALAIPQIGGLITRAAPPKTAVERAQQQANRQALVLLERGFPEPVKGNAPEAVRYAYIQLAGFIEIIAPRYDCRKF